MNDFKWGASVLIGGRTMLRPGFSLVGLTGIVVPTAPNTPPGCTTVAIDWEAGGYTPASGFDMDSLPLFVNVPTEHLEPLEESDEAARPALSIVKDDEPEPSETPSAPDETSPDEPDQPDERPKLRLI